MYNFLLEIEQGEDDTDVQQGENMSTMVEERQSGRFVTAREYYCYLMQVREGFLTYCYLEDDFSNNGSLTCM